MQTFITNAGFDYGVPDLDNKRLNKQLLECRQILNILITLRHDPEAKPAWRNHPAVLMWAGYEPAFYNYILAVVTELEIRGIKTEKNVLAISSLMDRGEFDLEEWNFEPVWWTDPVAADKIITSHRAQLYKKDPEHYAQFKFESDWVDTNRSAAVCCVGTKRVCNYYWPSHQEA